MADKTCKRKRKPNWTQEQLLLLAQLVDEKKDIIKGKFGVGITSKTKKDAWEYICGQINAAFPLVLRSKDDCEKRWYCLQSQARAEIAEFKRQTTATGGGSAPKALSPVASMVYSVLGHLDTSTTGLEGCIDPAMQLLNELEGAITSFGNHDDAPAPLLPAPLLPALMAPAALSPGPAPASPSAAGGGSAPSASLLEQKLELEISLLKKQHRLLDAQERLLQLQEEYYSQKLNMLKHRQSLE